MSDPKPSLGRIVLFQQGDSDPLPAIITKVWSDQVVNLHVFGPVGNPFPTSVPHASASFAVDGPRWSWPPRV